MDYVKKFDFHEILKLKPFSRKNFTAFPVIMTELIQHTWMEMEYQFYVYSATNRAYIKID